MQNSLYKYGHKIIASLIIITLMVNWRLFSSIGDAGLTLTTNLLIILWIALLAVSAVGLFLKRTWGFLCFYPAVLLTTIAFSISMLPFALNLFPLEMRPWAMTAINSIILLFVIWIHWLKSKHHSTKVA